MVIILSCLRCVAALAKVKFSAKLSSDGLAGLTWSTTSPQIIWLAKISILLIVLMPLLGVWIPFRWLDNFVELRQRNFHIVPKNPGLAGNSAATK